MTSKSKRKRNEDFIVKHKGEKYELSRFLQFHPGGQNYISPYKDLSITEKLSKLDHSQAAMYFMKEYRISSSKNDESEEDLEKLVDWSKPMTYQVGKLGSRYKEWVFVPVDRQLRLSHWNILEYLTITPWYLVPTIWIPVIFWLIYYGSQVGQLHIYDVYGVIWAIFGVLFGIFLWSLMEYSIHRWIFHMDPPESSPFLITLHFLMHGLHHKVPLDENRLLFPPVPAAVIATTLYTVLYVTLPIWMFYFTSAGLTTGYVIYDMMHFYLHYGSPEAGSYMYYMKRYHNQHHFKHSKSGFGISNNFWDRIFGTKIILRKLSRALKW